MNSEDHGRVNAGIALFITLTFLGSWFMVATLRLAGVTVAPEPLGTRLFTTSLLYALTMGWQPIVATWFVRRWVDPPDGLDLGLRCSGPALCPARRRCRPTLGGVLPRGLAGPALGDRRVFLSRWRRAVQIPDNRGELGSAGSPVLVQIRVVLEGRAQRKEPLH